MKSPKKSWRHRLFPLHFDEAGRRKFPKDLVDKYIEDILYHGLDYKPDESKLDSDKIDICNLMQQYNLLASSFFSFERYKLDIIKYYTSLNIVIIGGIGYLYIQYHYWLFMITLSVIGIMINIAWAIDYSWFKNRHFSKGEICILLEKKLPAKPITASDYRSCL